MRSLDIYIYNTIIVFFAILANTWEPELRTIKALSMLLLVALVCAIIVMPFLHWGVVGLADGNLLGMR